MRLLIHSLIILFSTSLFAQPSVQNNLTVQQYVLDVFQGTGVVINSISMNGLPGDSMNQQIGTFQNNGGYIPIAQGLVMSTGSVIDVDFNGDTVMVGEQTTLNIVNGQSGDPDLELLSNDNINDQAILEFDVVPEFQYITFNYAFGSEEYPEYVNSFNDAFGFFVSGPGIIGNFSNDADNIAILPINNTVVSINTVNNGNTGCFSGGPSGPCMNCEYYIDNCPIESTALDGMTTGLSALLEVIPGETYHFKLAIGDALDSAFDSAVFLEQYSFKSVATPPVGLPENDLIRALYPNPNDGRFTLEMDDVSITEVNLLDIQGKVMWTSSTSISSQAPITIDVSSMNAGLYFLEVIHDAGRSMRQVTIH
ncbi:MAG: T9SS type A sorting domain-containing protein [Flavobacteriales bacterium]|nr:T9SS type A sorting domain-containing protein [Flavobacteriales bacterium]